MPATIEEQGDSSWVIDIECGLEEDWGTDAIGASMRLAAHNEAVHPLTAAGSAAL